jgi:mannose-1-phosphate guanylyltransferase/phosphomannomutase
MIEYILELLAKHGVDEASLTLRYMPEKIIEHFSSGEFAGVNLNFAIEDTPLGTAGSVRSAVDFDEDFIIISGDALTDFDLTAAIEFHRATEAAATLIVKKVDDPREYGLVRFDKNKRIRGFLEKPDYSQADTEYANTGIYILSPQALAMIPMDTNYDFASDLFPQMLKGDVPIYAFESNGYWCDIGDISTYVSCQSDMLNGLVRCNIRGNEADLPENIIVHHPVYVGKNVTLREFCEIGPNTIINSLSHVGVGAKVRDSVMLEGSWAGDKARLTGALLCEGASVKRGGQLFEQSVVGARAIIGECSEVKPEVKVWPDKRVPSGSIIYENLKTGSNETQNFDENGIKGETGVDITPEFCARLGAACASLKSVKKIGVACGNSKAAQIFKSAFVAGVLGAGATAWDFGETFRSMHSFAQTFCGINLGIYFSSGVNTAIYITQDGALPTTRKLERELESLIRQSTFNRCAWSDIQESVNMSGVSLIYRQELMSLAPHGLAGIKAKVKSSDPEAGRVLSGVLQKLGSVSEGQLIFNLGSSGTQVSIYDPVCGYISPEQVLAMRMLPLLESGEPVAVPYSSPAAYDVLAKQTGGRIARYLSTPANDSDSEARALAASQPFVRDGLMTVISLLAYMKRTGSSISDLYSKLPDFAVSHHDVELICAPGKAINSLRDAYGTSRTAEEGLSIKLEKGTAKVIPSKKGEKLRLIAEAANAEFAREICGEIEETLSLLIHES